MMPQFANDSMWWSSAPDAGGPDWSRWIRWAGDSRSTGDAPDVLLISESALTASAAAARDGDWVLRWRRLADTGDEPRDDTVMIFLVAMSLPEDVGAEGLARFDAFYSDVHLSEVRDGWGFRRATRYRLDAELAHPAPGAPKFLSVYQADAEAAREVVRRRQAYSDGAPLWDSAPGPVEWNRRMTLWKQTYILESFAL